MSAMLRLAEQVIHLERRAVAHVHLSVYPPAGRVTLVAPSALSDQALRAFAIRKLDWIRTQQARLVAQERETPRALTTRESHQVWGRRRLLQVIEADARPSVTLHPARLVLCVRPGMDAAARATILAAWYREQIRIQVKSLVERWQARLGVACQRVHVQHMRTRWGSCTPAHRSIRLDTELARKPMECLEYILVHELLHLREPTHNRSFLDLLDQHLPDWRQRRDLLQRLPLRHEDWTY